MPTPPRTDGLTDAVASHRLSAKKVCECTSCVQAGRQPSRRGRGSSTYSEEFLTPFLSKVSPANLLEGFGVSTVVNNAYC